MSVAGGGKNLVICDSIAKYVGIRDTDMSVHPGLTVPRINDRIRSGEVRVQGYSRIILNVGTNDISNLMKDSRHRRTTIFDMMDRFVALRNSIRRRSSALLIFTSILPRANRFKLFSAYISGLNFAIERFCAKSEACIFAPVYEPFLSRGTPNLALFAESDHLHLRGAGVDLLESLLQQAMSTGYLIERVRLGRTKMLRDS